MNERVAFSVNQSFCKQLIIDQIPNIHISLDTVNHWYQVALGFYKSGKYAKELSMTEIVDLGAIQLQLLYGNHDPSKHTSGFLDDRGKNNVIHPTYKRDANVELEIYKSHEKYKDLTEVELKKKFTNLVRIAKRLAENFFMGYIYSADKIETREVGILASETVVIFDSGNQEILHQIPIHKLLGWNVQHTSTHEREKLRQTLGHVSHLHQIVLDQGQGLPVIRILTAKREELKVKLEGVLSHHKSSMKKKEEEEKMLERKNQQESNRKSVVVNQDLHTGQVIQVSTQCWLFDDKEVTANEVIVRLVSRKLILLDAEEKIILEAAVDWIKLWVS
eukprot:TRINITY_DN6648_c0_g1_i1.p1 TRINITY_DN6648_c0_g1~~TRINITY_DN6648_c0_g1_i1.p1  ORF type:complete len:333 (+),score=52.48 TRINITY_DN6648_c0_g1_i1:222-1220(+)